MDGYSPSTDPRLLPPLDPSPPAVNETDLELRSLATDKAKTPPGQPSSSPTVTAISYEARAPRKKSRYNFMTSSPSSGPPPGSNDPHPAPIPEGETITGPTKELPIWRRQGRRSETQPPVHSFNKSIEPLWDFLVKLFRILMSIMVVRFLVNLFRTLVNLFRTLMSFMVVRFLFWLPMCIITFVVILVCTIVCIFGWILPCIGLCFVSAAFFPIFFICDLCICGTSCPNYDHHWDNWDNWPHRLVGFGIEFFKTAAVKGSYYIFLPGIVLVNLQEKGGGYHIDWMMAPCAQLWQ